MYQKSRYRTLFCIGLLFLYGCDFSGAPPAGKGYPATNLSGAPPDGQSYLTVNLSGGAPAVRSGLARSVLSDDAIGGLVYKVRFTNPGGTVIERIAEGGSTSLALSAGAWSIAAEAYSPGDIGGVLVGTGTATVTVVPEQHQIVTIPMYVDSAYEAGLTDIYIHNEAELRRIGVDFAIDGAINFYLERDIVLTQPWTPIGSGSAPFKAVFDGQGHTVTVTSFGPAVKETDDVWVYQGFFAVVETAAVKNIHVKYELSDPVDISTGDGSTYYDARAGGVAGEARSSTFEDIRVSGNFSIIFDGTSSLSVGGMAGVDQDNASFTNCHVTSLIGGTSANYLTIGGLLGNSINGTIQDSSFTGVVSGVASGNCNAGGIAGSMDGDISTSYASAKVQGQGDGVYAGGVAGLLINGFIERCYAWTDVSAGGTSDVFVGGIAGDNQARITMCYARGSVLGENGPADKYAGGIVGANSSGTIQFCAALNDSISFLGALDVGGIGGGERLSPGTYASNYAASDITVNSVSTTTISGLIGDTTYTRSAFEGPPAGTLYGSAYLDWDFSSDWKFISGYNYPVLYWQTVGPADVELANYLGIGFTWP